MLDLDGAAAEEMFEGFMEFEDSAAKENKPPLRLRIVNWVRGLRKHERAAAQSFVVDESRGERIRRVQVLVRS